MCLIIFEEKTRIQDQRHLSLNRDRDRLQKYWAIDALYLKFNGKIALLCTRLLENTCYFLLISNQPISAPPFWLVRPKKTC